MKKFQIIVLLTFVGFLFSCKNTNSSDSSQQTPPNSADTSNEDTEKTTKPKTETILYAWVDKLRIREQPTTKSDIVDEVKEGTSFVYLKEKTDYTERINLRGTLFNEPWLKIKTQEGKEGWVYGGAVKFYEPIVDSNPSPYESCFELLKDKGHEKWSDCVAKVRKKQVKKDARFVKTSDTGLSFTLLDGKKKDFANVEGEDTETTIIRKYSHYLPKLGFFVTENTYFEGMGYSLINDKSGNEIRIKGFPKPSPDNKHLVTVSADLEVQMNYNGIEIFGFPDGNFTKIMEKEFSEEEPYSPIWTDNNSISLTLRPFPPTSNKNPRNIKIIKDEQGNWSVQD